jgi:hypothetical protein
MAETRGGGRSHDSGTSGGTDVEPLRGGMEEQDKGLVGPGPTATDEPPAPYHGTAVPEGGLAPRGEPAPDRGSTPREGAPPEPGDRGESATHPDDKIRQERRNLEREGRNTRRE